MEILGIIVIIVLAIANIINQRSKKPLKVEKKILIANVLLFFFLSLQVGITNLFIWN